MLYGTACGAATVTWSVSGRTVSAFRMSKSLFQDFFPQAVRRLSAERARLLLPASGTLLSRLRSAPTRILRNTHTRPAVRRGIGFYALPHTLIERRVAFPVCAACALRDVLDAFRSRGKNRLSAG